MTPSGVGPGPGPWRRGNRLGGISIVFLCCSATEMAVVAGREQGEVGWWSTGRLNLASGGDGLRRKIFHSIANLMYIESWLFESQAWYQARHRLSLLHAG